MGAHAVNQRLAGLQFLDLQGDSGPEHVMVHGGWVYTGVASGAVLRMREDGSQREEVLNTGGRPLGLAFDAEGALLIADPMVGAHGGLLRARLREGAPALLELLTDRVADDDPIGLADAVVVAPDGQIYFTDASRRFSPKAFGGLYAASLNEVLEHGRSGRVLAYDPASRRTRVLLSQLSMANGLSLSRDGRHLFVNESGEYRVWKLAVTAQAVDAQAAAAHAHPDARVLLANLPGFPDNLVAGEQGRIWLGMAGPRTALLDRTAGSPWLRKVLLRVTRLFVPSPPGYGHVIAFDEDGRILADLQDPTGAYAETTGATESAGRLYIHSLHAPRLGWLDKRAAGL